MKKEISRRDFLRGTMGLAAVTAMTGLTGCAAASETEAATGGAPETAATTAVETMAETTAAQGIYIPGTYQATANGMKTVTVTMTFDANQITDVVLDVSGETENIGQAAADTLIAQILEKQGTDIDGVSGATVTTTAVKVAADACIAQAKGESVNIPQQEAKSGSMLDLSFMDKPDPIPESQISKVLECDVAVVGLGVAGVCAARAAAEGGLKVTAIEKISTVSARSSQFSMFNCEKARELGIEDLDATALVNEMMTQMSHRADPRILKRWADHCGEAVTWYGNGYEGLQWLKASDPNPEDETVVYGRPMAAMPPYDPEVDHERIFSGTMNFRPKGHAPVLQANFDKALATGNVDAYFDSPARQLLTDESGRVTGVIFQSLTDDSYTQVNASRGVVLATGGFGHNDAMMAYYLPWIHDIIDRYNVTYAHTDIKANYANTGDGHQMGMWAGAQMEPGPLGSMAHGDFGKLGPDAFLQLNAQGERFTNEDQTNDHYGAQFVRQPSPIYMVFDANWPDQLPYMQGGLGSVRSTNPDTIASIDEWTAAKGDTIEELAANLGFTGEAYDNFVASVARYNELCDKGVDEDFGKTPKRMFALKTAPFYAIRDEGSLRFLVTLGGLKTNEKAQVLDKDYHVIEGLYAIGNTQGGRFVGDYPTTIAGASHSIACTYGYLVGKDIASL